MTNHKGHLVLSVGHTSHLVFFLNLKALGALDGFHITTIIQLHKCFDGKDEISVNAAKNISHDVVILKKSQCAFYGRNFIKHIIKGYLIKKSMKKRFGHQKCLLLFHGNSALTTNLISSCFNDKILFKQFNQYSLESFKLDFFNTMLVNVVNLFTGLRPMKVFKSSNEFDSRVHLNPFDGPIISYGSTNNSRDVLNFAHQNNRMPREGICIVGVPFQNWNLSDAVRKNILNILKQILIDTHIDEPIYYLRHPNETSQEFDSISDLSSKKIDDVTSKFISAEHFFLVNANLRLVVSVGSFAAISAYRHFIPTKVFFREICLGTKFLAEYEQKFEGLHPCIHYGYQGPYVFTNPGLNVHPLLERLNIFRISEPL